MHLFIPLLSIAAKELRELLNRPWPVLTLIGGPLLIMVIFGLGANANAQPPRAVVVVPQGQSAPQLLDTYRRQFERSLDISNVTDDLAAAKAQLAAGEVDAVVILPESPFVTIASGKQATIEVLYDQIDPIWRVVVPNFSRLLTSAINREMFLATFGSQQAGLDAAASDISQLLDTLDLAGAAADTWEEAQVRRRINEAQQHAATLAETLEQLGPEAQPLRDQVVQLRRQLDAAEQQIDTIDPLQDTDPRPLRERLGLPATTAAVRQLADVIDRFRSIPPEVLISPITVHVRNVAPLLPDVVAFYAPATIALLVQHLAVSMGALALVRERLSGLFDLYRVAPLSSAQLLIGKYLAYSLLTLAVAAITLVVLRVALGVPMLGSGWRLTLALVTLTLASVGLGFVLSLVAASERQAVQLAMLVLLGVVFFSGFTLPRDALIGPALALSSLLPATYGIELLQDIMLRGVPGSNTGLALLAAMAALLFGLCMLLMIWRMRAQ